MLKLSKTLNKVFRRYQEDIWGHLRLQEKNTKVSRVFATFLENKSQKAKPFFFDVNVAPPVRRRRKPSAFGLMLETRKKVCIFYGGLRNSAYRKVGKLAYNMEGNLSDNIASLLERSLAFAVYRANFASHMGVALELVRNGYVMVDKEVVKEARFIVPVGSVVEIVPSKKEELFNSFSKRLGKGHILCLEPKYMKISYTSMSFMFYKSIKFSEVLYPFEVPDYFYSSDFYNRY